MLTSTTTLHTIAIISIEDCTVNKAEKKRFKNALLDAFDYFGGTKIAFANAIGVSNGLVHHWFSGRSPVSLKKAFKIEKMTRGTVKAKDLVEWLPPQK